MRIILSTIVALLFAGALVGCSSSKKSSGVKVITPDDSAALVYMVPAGMEDFYPSNPGKIANYDGYTLVWNEEFSQKGRLNSAEWNYEHGFVRNNELQWYQEDNATVHDGCLDIEGRIEEVVNPRYEEGHRDWRRNRPVAKYTSTSVTTRGSHEFKYGRYEVRAKIPTVSGSWPAIWMLGNKHGWPENGELDLMEFYISNGQPGILANACWGGTRPNNGTWDSSFKPYSHFLAKDAQWGEKFHVWRMDWDKDYIRMYLDGELLNEIDLSKTFNKGVKGLYDNPFSNDDPDFKAYILLNLALGGNGGTPDDPSYPIHYLVDYVRVYSLQ